jgi:methyl-accepting chemotaxis protein
MLMRMFRISDWPFLVKLTAGPLLALAAMGALAWVGVNQLGGQTRTASRLVRNQDATALLAKATLDIETINGRMFRILALQAAQSADLKADVEFQALQKQVEGVSRTLSTYRDTYAAPEQREAIGGLIADIEKYKGAIAWVTQMMDVDFGSAVSFLKPFEGTFAELHGRLQAIQAARVAESVADANAATAAAKTTRKTFLWTTIIASTLVLLIALLIAQATGRSVRRIASVTLRLAEGDTEVDVSSLTRRDELGAIVRSLDVFRDGLLRVRSLQAQQQQEHEQAEASKRAALMGMAERIESETKIAIDKLGQQTTSMAGLADGMRESAVRTGQSSESAASAAALAQSNVQTVASAAEELSSSSREIGQQVSHSTRIVGLAVQAGTETRATIETLNQRVTQIGAVAGIISDIAAKTNLLALNATIEAARAGAAGKGFAVVASEVKALATQTARSTEEINRHIGEVRSATSASVEAVSRIEQTITEIDRIAGSIAAAVEQQGAATAEIARAVGETAQAAQEMTNRIAEVSTEAEQTGTRATDVHELASSLANAMVELKSAVIRMVRTSTAEVDRRRWQRLDVQLNCSIGAAGHPSQGATLLDISRGGACVRDGLPLRSNDRGTLRIAGLDLSLPFTVRSVESDLLRVEFDLDETGGAALDRFIEGLASRRSAA